VDTLTRSGALLVALLAAPALAEPAAPPLEPRSPDELARAALAASPALSALDQRLEAARAAAEPAGALPGPMLETMLQNVGLDQLTVGDEDMSMLAVELRQSLPSPRKRAARRVAADADGALVAAEARALRREIVAEIREAWAALYAIDAESAMLASAAESYELLSQAAATRYATGTTDLESAVRARLEAARLSERAIDLQAARALVTARLERLVDAPGGLSIPPVEALPPVDFPADGWPDEALREAAPVAAARVAIEAAERRAASAREELRPDLSVGGGAGYRGSLDPVLIVRFGVEWPAWSRDTLRPRVAAAEAEVRAARDDLRAAEAGTRAAAARAAALRAQAERQLVRVREGSLPLASAALDAARSAYTAGRGEFSAVVEDLNAWLEARVLVARREADLYAAWAATRALVPSAEDRALLGETP
jgi:outer membrane protein TolC